MKFLTFILMMSSFHAFAQNLSIDDLCSGKEASSKSGLKVMGVDGKDLVVVDKGFCAEYLKENTKELANLDKSLTLSPEICQTKVTDKWKLRFYASHSFTHYFNTDLKIKSSRYNVEIKDYQWAERTSREFFLPKTWAKPGNNPLQMIDEPTNTFVLSLEKNGHEFFLSAFHPKFIQDDSQVKDMTGTIDGNPVIPYQAVNTQFHGYTQTPGESKIIRNQNTHKEMIFEIGYGKRFTLLDTKFGKINYVPSVGLGVTVGQNYTVVCEKDKWWDYEDAEDNYGIQGFGGSLTNRVEFNTKNEKFGLFYENKLGYYKQKHGFMDGTQEYNLGFVGNSVGMKFMIHNPNNKKKPEAPF